MLELIEALDWRAVSNIALALLDLPLLKVVGSGLLMWIGIKLLAPEQSGPARVAGGMLVTDALAVERIGPPGRAFKLTVEIAAAVLVVTAGKWLAAHRRLAGADTPTT